MLQKIWPISLDEPWDVLSKVFTGFSHKIPQHHAHRDHGLGFCVFNDLGYTAKNLIAEGHVEKVLILDLDVHQGDGTIDICLGDPHIFTCSIHSESNFPFEKKQGWMDIGLPAGTKDEALYRPKGAYQECVLFLRNFADEIGLETEVVSVVENKPILIATWLGEGNLDVLSNT